MSKDKRYTDDSLASSAVVALGLLLPSAKTVNATAGLVLDSFPLHHRYFKLSIAEYTDMS